MPSPLEPCSLRSSPAAVPTGVACALRWWGSPRACSASSASPAGCPRGGWRTICGEIDCCASSAASCLVRGWSVVASHTLYRLQEIPQFCAASVHSLSSRQQTLPVSGRLRHGRWLQAHGSQGAVAEDGGAAYLVNRAKLFRAVATGVTTVAILLPSQDYRIAGQVVTSRFMIILAAMILWGVCEGYGCVAWTTCRTPLSVHAALHAISQCPSFADTLPGLCLVPAYDEWVLPSCRPAADAIFADSIPSGEVRSARYAHLCHAMGLLFRLCYR